MNEVVVVLCRHGYVKCEPPVCHYCKEENTMALTEAGEAWGPNNIQEAFEDFLTMWGYSRLPREEIKRLREAYFAGADEPSPEQFV
jgi:hypothetical protein